MVTAATTGWKQGKERKLLGNCGGGGEGDDTSRNRGWQQQQRRWSRRERPVDVPVERNCGSQKERGGAYAFDTGPALLCSWTHGHGHRPKEPPSDPSKATTDLG